MNTSLTTLKSMINWLIEKVFIAIDWVAECVYQWRVNYGKK